MDGSERSRGNAASDEVHSSPTRIAWPVSRDNLVLRERVTKSAHRAFNTKVTYASSLDPRQLILSPYSSEGSSKSS